MNVDSDGLLMSLDVSIVIERFGETFSITGAELTKTETSDAPNAVLALRHAIEVLSQSANAQDLCRRIAHAEFMDGFCQGVTAYLLDQRSVLVEAASYGRAHDFAQMEISAWDESCLARAIRSRRIVIEKIKDSTLFALPIDLGGVTTGAFLFTLSVDVPDPIFSRETTSMLSSLGGLFMDGKGLSLRSNPRPVTANSEIDTLTVQELTTRQVRILHFIADGLTNAEIAKHVLLSESTVRQETIRIFRILKCNTRSEAIVKARASGIIESVQMVDPGKPQTSD